MPVEGAASPRALVTNPRAGTVSVIDTATQRVTATIPIYRPTKVAFSPDGITAYVISEKGLAVIDANSLQIAAVIPLSAYSTELALSPDGSTVYVILTDRQKVEVIDTSILEVTDTIPVGADPKRGAFSPDGATVFVTDFDNDIVSVIDTVSRKVTGTIPVGHRTNDIAFSSDGTTAYVTCYYDHVVSVIDARTRRVTTSIPFAGDSNSVLGSLAFSPDGSLYVTSTNTLSVIDTTCHKITATIPVGPVNGLFLWSTYLAFTPNGKTAYLTEQEADRVLVIDTATLRVTGTINAGPAPYRVAIAAVPTVAQSITSLNVFPNPALACRLTCAADLWVFCGSCAGVTGVSLCKGAASA